MWLLLAGAALVSLAAWTVLYRLRRRRLYELADLMDATLPGEKFPQIPIFGHLHRMIGTTEDIMTTLKEMSYTAINRGGITPLWIGHILYYLITEPVDIEFVLKSCLEKDDLHRFLRNVIGNGIVFAPVSIWRRRRKVMAPAFSPKNLESFVEIFSEQSEILAEQLGAKVGEGGFDAWPFFSSYTLDSVSETVMGVKINAQTKNDGLFLTAMTETLHLVCERIFKLWLQPDWLYKFSPSYKHHQHSIGVLHDFTDEVISEKQQQLQKEVTKMNGTANHYDNDSDQRNTFLSLLIAQSNKDKGYTPLELREEVLSLTIAGTDTSAVGICFTLVLLGQHQDIQDKVYQELLDVYGNSERPVVKEDLPKLVYLERVIKESLRLYPPVPFIIRKVEKEITLPSGHVLPAGSGIPISIWGVHRNPRHWGADAEEFVPDRFCPERHSSMHPCAYLPFSGSPRNCLGYQYALMSMKTSIAAVLRRYRVGVVGDYAAGKQIPVKIDVMMKAAQGYNIVLESRRTRDAQ